MSEQTALVTGSSDGIGKQTALELAQRGMKVFIHARNPERGQAALAELRKQAPNGNFDAVSADFASLSQIRQMADDFRQRAGKLDILINNAGVKPLEHKVTEDGYELTFAVNHLAHFWLTNWLLDLLRESPQGRVVTVSSVSHYRGKMHFDDLQLTHGWDSYTAYAQSKLANVLFAFGLARRLEGTHATSNAVHPGVVTTKLLVEGFGSTGGSLADGAATSVLVAVDPDLAKVNGEFFGNRQRETPAPATHDLQQQDQLWTLSEQLQGLQKAL